MEAATRIKVWGRFMVMQSGKKGTSTTNVGSTFFGTEPSIASELVNKGKNRDFSVTL